MDYKITRAFIVSVHTKNTMKVPVHKNTKIRTNRGDRVCGHAVVASTTICRSKANKRER